MFLQPSHFLFLVDHPFTPLLFLRVCLWGGGIHAESFIYNYEKQAI